MPKRMISIQFVIIMKPMNSGAIRIILVISLLLPGDLLRSQDYEFINTTNGIDILFPDRLKLDFGESKSFAFSVNGQEFRPEISHSAERACRVSAESYTFNYVDGMAYRFIFSVKYRNGNKEEVNKTVTYRRPQLHAISVGVNEKYGSLPALKKAQKSAAQMNLYAKNMLFFPKYSRGETYLIASGTETPNSAHFQKRLSAIRSEAQRGDILLLYFACHGEIMPDGSFSFILDNGERYSGDALAGELSRMPIGVEKIIIVCSCFSRYLWQSLSGIKDVTLIYASDKLTQGDNFADNLIALLDKTKQEEMSFSYFSKTLVDSHPGAGLFPITNLMDYCVSNPPESSNGEVPIKKKSNLVPAFLSIAPGAGQYYKGHYLKGACFTGGALLLGGGGVVCESLRSKYLKQASQTYDINVINSLSSKANDLRTASTICFIGTGLVVLGSILDAAISTPKKDKKVQVTPQGITYNF